MTEEEFKLTHDEKNLVRENRARTALQKDSPALYQVASQVGAAIDQLIALGELVEPGNCKWDEMRNIRRR